MNEKGFFEGQVPTKYRDAEIDLLDLQTQALRNYGKEWAKNPTSIFLHGNKGSGKTRFAFAIIREMFRRCPTHIWPRYYTSPELDSRLHRAIMDGGDRHVIENLCKEDLLFIDDFGRETDSERVKRQYFEIINYRYSYELPTILTSNYNLDEISGRLGDVISSRIEEWRHIRFTGNDIRKQEMVV
jgi:DNA replication protein DnaC